MLCKLFLSLLSPINCANICRERREPDFCQILRLPQVLRPHPDLGQTRRLRHAAARQEGLLCPRLQWREGRAALGQPRTKVRFWRQNLFSVRWISVSCPPDIQIIFSSAGKPADIKRTKNGFCLLIRSFGFSVCSSG